MMGWNNGTGWHTGPGWGGTGILMLLFWGLVIWGIVWLVRHMNASDQKNPDRTHDREAMTSSDEILATRFVRGEIDAEEYSRRLSASASTGDTKTHRNDRTVA